MIVCNNEYDECRMEMLINMPVTQLNERETQELRLFRWDILTVYSMVYLEQWDTLCESLLVEPEIDKANVDKRLRIDWEMHAEEVEKALEFAEIFLEKEKNRDV